MNKKKDDIKQKIIQEETVHAAFNSSDTRPCNKKIKHLNPGPGTYININNPQHCSIKCAGGNQSIDDRSFQEEQGIKLGPFGSNTDRFFKSWLNPKLGPDPGQYQKKPGKLAKGISANLMIEGKSQASTRAFTAGNDKRSKISSVFMSTTDRFNLLENRNPNVRILNPDKFKKGKDDSILNTSLMQGTDQVMRFNDKVQYDFKDTRTEWAQKIRANDYEAFSGKHIAFD